MSRLTAALYDRIIRPSEDACLRSWRAELLADLSGQVLEIGAGTGLNLPYFPAAVRRLVISEPDADMREKLRSRISLATAGQVEIVDAAAQALPVAAGEFDAVVGTLVLCSVPDVAAALAEIHRVLRPGGWFVFLEHVAAEGMPGRLKWQRRFEPLWKRLSGNCHLTRHTAEAIAANGFSMQSLKRESMRKAFPIFRPTVRGVAIKATRPVT